MAILSTPALAAALRTLGRTPLPPLPVLEPRQLSPMYRLTAGDLEQEATAAAHLAAELAERLRRLNQAYGEWDLFEPGPYFDLQPEQTELLVHVVERVSTVHVCFYVDALLPAFQAAVAHLHMELAPSFGRNGADAQEQIAAQEQMAAHWRRLVAVMHGARQRLEHDTGFLITNNAGEERARWRAAWQQPAAPLLPELTPRLPDTPTLTLSTDFPLPAYRQPGRLRRLRRAQQRRMRSGYGSSRTRI